MLDELERVRAFGADLPGPDEATVESARAQLLDAITAEPQADRDTAAAAVATRRILIRRSPAWLSLRRRLAVGVGLAVAAVAVVIALTAHTTTIPQKSGATTQNALSEEMNRLADVAAAQHWTPLTKGKYLYRQSYYGGAFVMDEGNCTINFVNAVQTWVDRDGDGAAKSSVSDGRFTSAAQKKACARVGITSPNQATRGRALLTYAVTTYLGRPITDWSSYSTDPKVLLRQLHKWDHAELNNTPQEYLENVADFLRQTDPPPKMAAAAYRATTVIPGIRLLGNRTDQKGQTGIAVGIYQHGKPVRILIFDPNSSRMLAEEDYGNGMLDLWEVYTKQAVVNSHPNYPHGNQG